MDPDGSPRTVIAWLWARTVTCPNPACRAQMPLVRSFWLSKKKGKQAWVEPVVDRSTAPAHIRFTVRTGVGRPGQDGTVDRRGAVCIACNTPVPFPYIRDEGRAGRMGAQLMAMVAEGDRGRVYLPPDEEHESIARNAQPPADVPDTDLPEQALGFRVQLYGMTKHRDLFTPRQLVALTTFSDLVAEARERVRADAVAAGLPDDGVPLNQGGRGASAYADAVATYLAFASSKLADRNSSLSSWDVGSASLRSTFGRQALPMVWDYCETNPFESMGSLEGALGWIERLLSGLPTIQKGVAFQINASKLSFDRPILISTDPPYYDNIGYADLSDFFYIWLRRSLGQVYPDLFATLLVPKSQELVATPYRFGGDKHAAATFFEKGLLQAFARMREVAHLAYPLTVYYAFKQAETNGGEVASTGWETMLEGLVRTGFQITGTWPMRTELGNRPVASGTNALASSIVLVCRVRPEDAPLITRRDFLRELQQELPRALKDLQRGNIAPVDLAQAAIGPGMAVFSRYRRVVEADGSAMTVRMALALINQMLDEFLAEQEGEFDPDTRWAVAWFEQYAFDEGPYGDAETLSTAKNTSVQGMVQAGILHARAGRVRLLRREELPADWDPATDRRVTVWEVTHHLIRTLEEKGEVAAAELLAQAGPLGDPARDLAYRLYTICERKGWAQEALPYNALVASWSDVGRLVGQSHPEQGRLL